MTDPATPEELHEALRSAPWAFTGRSPDASELMDWLDQQTQPIAVAYLGVVLRNAERGAVCVMAEHDAYPTQVDRLLRQVVANLATAGRFRSAWLSARRRAARVTEVLEALATDVADLPITLVLDEHRETVRWEEADPAAHPRHTDDLRTPDVLTGHDAGGRPYFDHTRPWWLCHVRGGWIHTEGPCVVRTDPLDLRAGQGPMDPDRVRQLAQQAPA